MSEPSKISAAAKVLDRAERKLAKITEKASETVAKAVTKAEAKNASKIQEATAAVSAAKTALVALAQ